MSEAATQQPARRGPAPLGASVRQRLLRDMLARAAAGSAEHAAALVRLSLEVERAEREVDRRGERAA